MATSSVYGKSIRESSNEKESSRKKEVDDLISKYARKKAPPPPMPPPPTAVSQNHGLQRDYSNTSLNKYGSASSSQNITAGGAGGQRDSFYGGANSNLYGGASSTNLRGGASSSNLYAPPHRRSSQYDIQAQYPEPIYEPNTPRQQKYLATSKSSSNLYLQPQYGSGSGYEPGSNRSMGRQHKTLSMHGAPSVNSGRNNAVMETAASIIG